MRDSIAFVCYKIHVITKQTSPANKSASSEAQLQAEVRRLRAQVELLETENRVLLARIAELTNKLATETNKGRQQALALELKILQERVNQRNRELFGSKSEKRGRPESAEPKPKPKRKVKRSGSKRTEQPDLPTLTVRHELDEADQVCPECGGKLYAKGDTCERSERITVTERVYTVVTDEKQVYGCGGCGHSEAALPPPQLVPGGRYDSSVAISVAVDKFVDHQPLNRQVKTMRRAGLRVTRQSLWDYLLALAVMCEPSFKAHHQWMLNQHSMLHADETSWRMMLKGGSTKWWLWAIAAHDGFLCLALPTRGAKGARQLLRDFDGELMTDGYSVYKALAKEAAQEDFELDEDRPWQPKFRLFVCWSHARRRFEQASNSEDDATEVLDLIAELYAVEAEAKERANGDRDKLLALRAELRASRSAAILDEINRWRRGQLSLPGTKMAEGLCFLENQWAGLSGFVEHPAVPLDNNLIERQVRTPVLGRRNHLGSRSPRGAQVSALFYSLLGSCRMLGVSPVQYLSTVVERGLQTEGYALTPYDFAAEVRVAASGEEVRTE